MLKEMPALCIRPYVAGYGDLEFDPAGYVLGMVSCVLQASYLICVEKSGAEKGVSSVEMMVYNAMLSAPPLTLLAWLPLFIL